MTGERILYIVLIAVAIGIGIYGSMNNLFRPHVYAECHLRDNSFKTGNLYINEREDYLILYVLPNKKVGVTFELVDTEGSIYGEDSDLMQVWPQFFGGALGNTFVHIVRYPDGQIANEVVYQNCKVTRQFLQKGFDEMFKT